MMRKAFSLMEVLVVLLIVSVIAAASAPMLNRKTLMEASDKSPWVRTNGLSIAFNLNGDNNTSATIGARQPSGGGAPRLAIEAPAGDNPHISFGDGEGTRIAGLWLGNGSINMGSARSGAQNSVVIGNEASVNNDVSNSVVIGSGSSVIGNNSVVIGQGIFTNSSEGVKNSVTIGRGLRSANGSIFIASDESSSGFGVPDNTVALIANLGQSENGLNSYITAGNDRKSSTNSVFIGSSLKILVDKVWSSGYRGKPSVLIGNDIEVSGKGSIAIGQSLGDFTHEDSDVDDALRDNFRLNTSVGKYDSNGIKIGSDILAGKGIAIGRGCAAVGPSTVALGSGFATEEGAVIINAERAVGRNSVAISGGKQLNSASFKEHLAKATGDASIAIGMNTEATKYGSTAIGFGAKTTEDYQVVLGDEKATVYIPGNLVVGGNVYLGTNTDSQVWARIPELKSNNTKRLNFMQILRHYEGGGWAVKTLSNPSNITIFGETLKSDRRLKNVGKVFTGGLEEIKKLEVFNYTFKKDKEQTPRVGVMAQDLQKIFPNAVFKGDDGFLRIRMEDMFYALVNAVKELDKKIDLLIQKQKKIDELEAKVDKLEKRLADLEKKLK